MRTRHVMNLILGFIKYDGLLGLSLSDVSLAAGSGVQGC